MAPIYVPHDCRLPSGRMVRAGRYDAELVSDGRALVRIRRFKLSDRMQAFNERWALPASVGGTAGVFLSAHQFEMAPPDGCATIESPIDALFADA